MSKHLKTQFVVADGSRARWVKRSDHADDFVTVEEAHAEANVYDLHPQGVVFEGSAGQRFSVAERDEAVRHRQAQFPEKVSRIINEQAERGQFERLVLVAPARTLNVIKAALSAPARAKLGETLAKDLTKTSDHELGAWLRPLEFG